MIQIETTRFGQRETLAIDEGCLFSFPDGLPGFDQVQVYALLEDDRCLPLRWLQAIDQPEVCFILVDPWLVLESFEVELGRRDLASLRIAEPDQAEVHAILAIRDQGASVTANLKAPIVLNRSCRLGRQIILADDRFELRQPVAALAGRPTAGS